MWKQQELGRKGVHYVISRKTGRKETTRKTRRRWVDSIKMNLAEIGWRGIDWTDLAQDRY
jgi:hypothetical protein